MLYVQVLWTTSNDQILSAFGWGWLRSGLPWLFIMAPIGGVFGVVTTRGLVRRIHRLAKTTTQFAAGQYKQRILVARKDEVGQLEQSFNQMAEQLVESMAQRQVLIEHLNPLMATTFASVVGNEQQALKRVAEAVDPLHLSAERLDSLKTAVAEAVMNAMEHGNGYQPDKVVVVQVLASDASIVVRVRDQGEGRPIPEAVVAPDLDAQLAGLQAPRGWGFFLIKSLVDEMYVTN